MSRNKKKMRIKPCDYFDFETQVCFTSKIVIDLSGDCKDLVFNTRLQKLSVNDVKDLVRLHIPPRVGKTQHKAVTEGEKKSKFVMKLTEKRGKKQNIKECVQGSRNLFITSGEIHQLSEAIDDLS